MKSDPPDIGPMLRAMLPPDGLHDDTWLCAKCRTTTRRTTEDYDYDITCGYDGEIMILVSRQRVLTQGEYLDSVDKLMDTFLRVDAEAYKNVYGKEEDAE